MTAAVVIATAISASPVAARLVETAVGAPVRASVDPTRLPVGDGKVVRQPTVGGLWSCEQRFTGSGAFREGPWFRGDGAYDATAKAIVDGDVQWPHQFSIDLSGGVRTFTGNNLPNHGTGIYPVSPTDDAYLYDRNPNSIDARTVQFSTPAIPTPLAQPTCAPGAVGILLTGSYLFNAVDAGGRDAVAHETQDRCQGHPAPGSVYHYHSLSSCMDGGDPGSHSPLMGYAFDGFGIYGFRGEDGAELSNEDLDACHGHTHVVEWDGQPLELYHYHATQEFPYTVGCFRGRAAQVRPGADSSGNPPTGPGAPGSGPNGGNGPTNGAGPAGGPPPGQGGGPGAGGPPPGPPAGPPPPGQGQRLPPPPSGAQGR